MVYRKEGKSGWNFLYFLRRLPDKTDLLLVSFSAVFRFTCWCVSLYVVVFSQVQILCFAKYKSCCPASTNLDFRWEDGAKNCTKNHALSQGLAFAIPAPRSSHPPPFLEFLEFLRGRSRQGLNTWLSTGGMTEAPARFLLLPCATLAKLRKYLIKGKLPNRPPPSFFRKQTALM